MSGKSDSDYVLAIEERLPDTNARKRRYWLALGLGAVYTVFWFLPAYINFSLDGALYFVPQRDT